MISGLFRVDAGEKIGFGHFMRSLALAQAFKRHGHTATFLSRSLPPMLSEALRRSGIDVKFLSQDDLTPSRDALGTSEVAAASSCKWIVLDGYNFDSEYQRDLRKRGERLLVIDDNGGRHEADIVLNQNATPSDRERYDVGEQTSLLLGHQYILLRNEFLEYRGRPKKLSGSDRNILITMGGGDLHHQTQKAVEAVQMLEDFSLNMRVVVGAGHPDTEELEREAKRSGKPITLLTNIINLAPEMAWADIAIGAGGSTCWEMCFLGLPSVTLETAENQKLISPFLKEKGCGLPLGEFHQVTASDIATALRGLLEEPDRLLAMSRAGQSTVDGLGADRVVEFLEKKHAH